MDWRSASFDWNQARAFLVTAQEGSLSAAARALSMTQPTLGRQVAALESELGVLLFDRVGRRLVLTPSGLELIEHVQAMGAAANQLSLAASGQSQSLEGVVSIAAGEALSAYLLPPIVAKLRAQHPEISLHIVASDAVSDLARREADIAIRHFRPPQPDLITKKLCEKSAYLYATPEYLTSLGSPVVPDDFSHAEFLGYDDTDILMDILNARGFGVTRESFSIRTKGHLVNWEYVKRGLGIGAMMADVGDAEPCVQRVLGNVELIQFPIWLTSHRELQSSRRLKLVFDLLAQHLK